MSEPPTSGDHNWPSGYRLAPGQFAVPPGGFDWQAETEQPDEQWFTSLTGPANTPTGEQAAEPYVPAWAETDIGSGFAVEPRTPEQPEWRADTWPYEPDPVTMQFASDPVPSDPLAARPSEWDRLTALPNDSPASPNSDWFIPAEMTPPGPSADGSPLPIPPQEAPPASPAEVSATRAQRGLATEPSEHPWWEPAPRGGQLPAEVYAPTSAVAESTNPELLAAWAARFYPSPPAVLAPEAAPAPTPAPMMAAVQEMPADVQQVVPGEELTQLPEAGVLEAGAPGVPSALAPAAGQWAPPDPRSRSLESDVRSDWAPPHPGELAQLDAWVPPVLPGAAHPETTVLPAPGTSYQQFYRTPVWRPWRVVVALLVGVVAAFAAILAATVVVLLVDPSSVDLQTGTVTVTPIFFLGNNVSISLFIPVAMLVAFGVFKQRPGWLASVTGRFRWRWFGWCVAAIVPIWAINFGIDLYFGIQEGYYSFVPRPDSVFLICVIVFTTPLQCAGEEYAIRGLLNRAVASCFRNPKVSWTLGAVVSSVVFMLLHGSSDPMSNGFYFTFGMLACFLAWRTGGLEAPIALHVVNNLVAEAMLPFTGVGEVFSRGAGSLSLGSLLLQVGVTLLCVGAVTLLWYVKRPVSTFQVKTPSFTQVSVQAQPQPVSTPTMAPTPTPTVAQPQPVPAPLFASGANNVELPIVAAPERPPVAASGLVAGEPPTPQHAVALSVPGLPADLAPNLEDFELVSPADAAAQVQLVAELAALSAAVDSDIELLSKPTQPRDLSRWRSDPGWINIVSEPSYDAVGATPPTEDSTEGDDATVAPNPAIEPIAVSPKLAEIHDPAEASTTEVPRPAPGESQGEPLAADPPAPSEATPTPSEMPQTTDEPAGIWLLPPDFEPKTLPPNDTYLPPRP